MDFAFILHAFKGPFLMKVFSGSCVTADTEAEAQKAADLLCISLQTEKGFDDFRVVVHMDDPEEKAIQILGSQGPVQGSQVLSYHELMPSVYGIDFMELPDFDEISRDHFLRDLRTIYRASGREVVFKGITYELRPSSPLILEKEIKTT